MRFPFLSSMEKQVEELVKNHKHGLYLALIFPMMFSFLLTFAISRLVSYTIPYVYLELSSGLHIHHFTYGIFILMIAGYLALVFDGPQAKFFIALLFGVGLGLAFDEFGMWLRLRDDDPVRWEYDGFGIIVGIFLFLMTFKPGVLFILHHEPFRYLFKRKKNK